LLWSGAAYGDHFGRCAVPTIQLSELIARRRTLRFGFEVPPFVVPGSDEPAPSAAWILVRGLQGE
jgi:hypothetical protein